VQLVQLVHDQSPGSVVSDGMLVDGAPAYTPAAAADTTSGAKGDAGHRAHSLPGSLAALKPIVGMLVVEGTMCVACTHM